MKTLNQYIKEKLIINTDYKDYRDTRIVVKTVNELRKIIEYRYDKLGPGTKQNPIDFNDIDVSNLNSFHDKNNGGIFVNTKFKYIDISYWDVSNATNMAYMFYMCKELESVGNISKWDVSNVTNMIGMFYECRYFNQDISSWNVSNLIDMSFMFYNCKSFNQDISSWNVSNVTNMLGLFYGCESFNQDISSWNVSNVPFMSFMFYNCKSFSQDLSCWDASKVIYNIKIFENCPIKEEYKPKFK